MGLAKVKWSEKLGSRLATSQAQGSATPPTWRDVHVEWCHPTRLRNHRLSVQYANTQPAPGRRCTWLAPYQLALSEEGKTSQDPPSGTGLEFASWDRIECPELVGISSHMRLPAPRVGAASWR